MCRQSWQKPLDDKVLDPSLHMEMCVDFTEKIKVNSPHNYRGLVEVSRGGI